MSRGFGFAVTTFAGPIEQCNEWKSSWSDFYANNRLRYVSKIVAARHHEERELVDRVEQIAKEVVPKLISDDRLNDGKGVTPALVHGDLWSGNKARGVIYDEHGNHDGKQDYAFDASCCYAHSEYGMRHYLLIVSTGTPLTSSRAWADQNVRRFLGRFLQ